MEYGILRYQPRNRFSGFYIKFLQNFVWNIMTTMPVITSSLNYTVLLARVSADRTRSDHVKFKKPRDFETHDIMCSEKTEVATPNDGNKRKFKRQEKSVAKK